MASEKEYLDYWLSLIDMDNKISYKMMMGEFLLYFDGLLFGGIYDNRFLVKKTKSLQVFSLPLDLPYPNALPMYLITIEDKEVLKRIIESLVNDLRSTK